MTCTESQVCKDSNIGRIPFGLAKARKPALRLELTRHAKRYGAYIDAAHAALKARGLSDYLILLVATICALTLVLLLH